MARMQLSCGAAGSCACSTPEYAVLAIPDIIELDSESASSTNTDSPENEIQQYETLWWLLYNMAEPGLYVFIFLF